MPDMDVLSVSLLAGYQCMPPKAPLLTLEFRNEPKNYPHVRGVPGGAWEIWEWVGSPAHCGLVAAKGRPWNPVGVVADAKQLIEHWRRMVPGITLLETVGPGGKHEATLQAPLGAGITITKPTACEALAELAALILKRT